MTEGSGSYRTPYTPTPGSSTPPPEMTPDEGRADLIGFAWLALLNTAIIAVVGVGVWLYMGQAL